MVSRLWSLTPARFCLQLNATIPKSRENFRQSSRAVKSLTSTSEDAVLPAGAITSQLFLFLTTRTLNYQFVWRSGFWLCKASRSIWSIYLVPTTLLIFVLVKHSISGSNGSSPVQYFTYFVQRVKGSVQQRPYHWQPHIVPCNFRKCRKWKRRRCRKKYFRCWMDVKKKNKELSYPSLFSKDEENDLTVIS